MYIFVGAVIFLVGLIQIPLLVDMFRAFSPRCKLRRATHWCVKVLLVTVMTTFFVIGLSYFVLVFLPLTVDQPFYSYWGILHFTFALWIWINIVFNYYMAVIVHPGSVEMPPEAKNATSSRENPADCIQWNRPCYHYCHVCQENVAYMDHHCPFTGNCTGLKNYSYFLLFLIYGALGLGYALWMSFPYFKMCVLSKVWWVLGYVEHNDQNSVCIQLGPHTYIVLAVMGGLYVTVNMTILQVLLLFADLSSYDILKNLATVSVFSFACQRIRKGKYKDPKSRMNVLLLKQRASILWFLVPGMNINDKNPLSIMTNQ